MAAITQLDTENADRNLTAEVAVLTDTPDVSNAILCQGIIYFGDGVKDLDGTGGDFTVRVTVGENTINGGGETRTLGTQIRSTIVTEEFPVPANAAVVIYVTSPNGADTDVDVTAYLYDIGPATVAGVQVDLIGDLNATAVIAIQDGLATSTALTTAQDDLDLITGTDGAVLASSQDVYHALIEYTFDSPVDEYTVTWVKNGQRVLAGITSPTIQVVKRADGTDLVGSTAMTQIGSTGSYKYDEPTNVTDASEAYLTILSATIDGGSRSFSKLVRR